METEVAALVAEMIRQQGIGGKVRTQPSEEEIRTEAAKCLQPKVTETMSRIDAALGNVQAAPGADLLPKITQIRELQTAIHTQIQTLKTQKCDLPPGLSPSQEEIYRAEMTFQRISITIQEKRTLISENLACVSISYLGSRQDYHRFQVKNLKYYPVSGLIVRVSLEQAGDEGVSTQVPDLPASGAVEVEGFYHSAPSTPLEASIISPSSQRLSNLVFFPYPSQ